MTGIQTKTLAMKEDAVVCLVLLPIDGSLVLVKIIDPRSHHSFFFEFLTLLHVQNTLF